MNIQKFKETIKYIELNENKQIIKLSGSFKVKDLRKWKKMNNIKLENMELRFILELLKTANLKYPTDWNLNLYNKIQKQIKDRGLKNE